MAVFTSVELTALDRYLSAFSLGKCVHFEGIASGIENTNYFVTTEAGQFVLTLFEHLPVQALPFYIDLLSHLSAHQLAVPEPQTNRAGEKLATLCGKPALLVNRLSGIATEHPNTLQCHQLGSNIAQLHQAAKSYDGQQANLRSLPWWQAVAPALQPKLSPDQNALFEQELQAQKDFFKSSLYVRLPQSVVHADLFRDNVLMQGNQVGGIIDFYFAGVDKWLFDLAVCANDWCIESATGEWNEPRLAALLAGYSEVRSLTDVEVDCWPLMLRTAAFRFWVSRLYDWYLPRPAQALIPKSPLHFEQILRQRIATAAA